MRIRYKATVLCAHLDKEAKKKIISLENDYPAAIKKLETFYGDKRKVIEACMEKITKYSAVGEKDNSGLVNLKTVICNNYNQMKYQYC